MLQRGSWARALRGDRQRGPPAAEVRAARPGGAPPHQPQWSDLPPPFVALLTRARPSARRAAPAFAPSNRAIWHSSRSPSCRATSPEP